MTFSELTCFPFWHNLILEESHLGPATLKGRDGSRRWGHGVGVFKKLRVSYSGRKRKLHRQLSSLWSPTSPHSWVGRWAQHVPILSSFRWQDWWVQHVRHRTCTLFSVTSAKVNPYLLRLTLWFIIQIFLFMISSFICCPKVLPRPPLELSSGNVPISKGFVFHFHKVLLLELPWGGVTDARGNMCAVKEVETLVGPQLCTIRLCSWLPPPLWSGAAHILPSLPPHLDNFLLTHRISLPQFYYFWELTLGLFAAQMKIPFLINAATKYLAQQILNISKRS